MNIPRLEDADIFEKKVIVRADLDVDLEKESKRLEVLKPTLDYLLEKKAKIIIIGHKGRPEGKVDNKLSLQPVCQKLKEVIKRDLIFIQDNITSDTKNKIQNFTNAQILLLENLRFNPGEESNDEGFAKDLSSLADFYINEAFASSHREHASIIGIPKYLNHSAGLHFYKEVEYMNSIFENPKRPILVIISGVKEDKISYINDFKKFADKILIGGLLPNYLSENIDDPKLIKAQLIADKEDITINSIEIFEQEIKKAKTIVLAGPIGKFEDEGHRQGTERVFKAVANSPAFKIAGGGDTEKAINLFGLEKKFDWISVGGGASLEFLAKGTLPGIKALQLQILN